MRSMIVTEVNYGAYAYADRIACDESDPLAILIAAEDGMELNCWPRSSAFMGTTCLERSDR